MRGALAGVAALASPHAVMQRARAQSAPDGVARLADGRPSETARGAAMARALHQVVDYPRILDDPLALPMIGRDGAQELQAAADRGSRASRASIVLRSRYAEDRLAAAVERGVRQYVLLGAGLDTFAYRNPHADRGLRVFEVDHPATQRWKRTHLEAAGIRIPASALFVPVDFETQTLAGQLQRMGFRADRPAFFSMLGVVIYLTESAVMDTLHFVSSCASGSEIAFSFSVPDSHLDGPALERRERSRRHMETLGEPWQTFFDPVVLTERLRATGFTGADIVTAQRANDMYFARRVDGLRLGSSAHMASAWT